MRKIEVIFSEADKELVEKLRCRHEKLAERYLALANFAFTIIAGIILIASIALGVMLHFTTCTAAKKSSYDIPVVITSLISAGIILFLIVIGIIFQRIHDDHFANALHYQFMSEHMQEISELENNLMFSISKTCPNVVIYHLPDSRYRCIETVNNIPADGDVIITVKEDTDKKGRISLDWYAKTI